MERFTTARDAALKLRPDVPVYCFRPHVLREDAKTFKALFPGTTAYAVKTNGEPMVIRTLVEAGIDVANGAALSILGHEIAHCAGAQH